MSSKLKYWLLPLLAIMFYILLKITCAADFIPDSLLYLLLLLSHYLLFLFLCKKGLQIFEPPTPSTKRSLFALLAAVCLIPLFYMAAYKINAVALAGDYDKRLEPVYSMNLHLAFLLAGLVTLRILGFRPPRGKCLLMCFLPMLVFATVGTALILIACSGFWLSESYIYAAIEEMPPIQRWLSEITAEYFTYATLPIYFVISSFTVYWTMKYNHELSSALPKGSP